MEKQENQKDLLKFIVDSGMINLSYVQEQIEMNKRKELLEKHPYSIWQGKDGKWYTYLPDKEKGRILKKKSTEKSIEDAVVIYWKAELENPTVKEIFDEWNDRRLRLKKIAESTYCRNQRIFKRFFAVMGNERIKSLTPEDIEDFLEEQIAEYELTAKAFCNLKSITRGVLKRAKKRKLIEFNVEEIFDELDTSETSFKKVIKDDAEEVFDDEEMERAIQYLQENPDIINLGILLIFYTGLRVGELVALKWEDVRENSILIRRTETRYEDENGKSHHVIKDFPKTDAGVRDVVIPESAFWILKKLRTINPFGDFIFMRNGKRVNTFAVRRRLYHVCEETGCVKKSPHKIRKTYGSILLDNHIDRKLIESQMGHTNILCTENYYHRNRKSNMQKREILSDIPEFRAVR